ncbi:MAG: M20/M25/M40 family metallo-hydrolase [Candidatus Eisenbacteria bacterium]
MVSRKDFEPELLDILRALIRIDTSNPPGNEMPAAEYVKELMDKDGIPAKIFASTPTRGSVVARLKGSGEKPPLLLLSHLDVVPVEPDLWSVAPFAAEVRDGCVWGRGTVDIKNLTATEIAVLLLVKRLGLKLKRDVILAATADEEAGATYGMKWLIQNHFDEIKAEYAINEGGVSVDMNGRKLLLCQTAEKGICWVRVTVKGAGGHGSLPTRANPVVLAAQIIARIGQHPFPVARTPVSEKLIAGLEKQGLLPPGVTSESIFSGKTDVLAYDSTTAKRLNAFIRNTATPTVVRGGTKVNVIPMETQFSVDCRVLPGFDPDEMLATVKGLVALPDAEYEILQKKRGTESRTDTELWRVLEESVTKTTPGAVFLPYVSPGGTDSGFLRENGVTCYGFEPAFLPWEQIDAVHGIDERISVDALADGTVLLFDVIRRFCT